MAYTNPGQFLNILKDAGAWRGGAGLWLKIADNSSAITILNADVAEGGHTNVQINNGAPLIGAANFNAEHKKILYKLLVDNAAEEDNTNARLDSLDWVIQFKADFEAEVTAAAKVSMEGQNNLQHGDLKEKIHFSPDGKSIYVGETGQKPEGFVQLDIDDAATGAALYTKIMAGDEPKEARLKTLNDQLYNGGVSTHWRKEFVDKYQEHVTAQAKTQLHNAAVIGNLDDKLHFTADGKSVFFGDQADAPQGFTTAIGNGITSGGELFSTKLTSDEQRKTVYDQIISKPADQRVPWQNEFITAYQEKVFTTTLATMAAEDNFAGNVQNKVYLSEDKKSIYVGDAAPAGYAKVNLAKDDGSDLFSKLSAAGDTADTLKKLYDGLDQGKAWQANARKDYDSILDTAAKPQLKTAEIGDLQSDLHLNVQGKIYFGNIAQAPTGFTSPLNDWTDVSGKKLYEDILGGSEPEKKLKRDAIFNAVKDGSKPWQVEFANCYQAHAAIKGKNISELKIYFDPNDTSDIYIGDDAARDTAKYKKQYDSTALGAIMNATADGESSGTALTHQDKAKLLHFNLNKAAQHRLYELIDALPEGERNTWQGAYHDHHKNYLQQTYSEVKSAFLKTNFSKHADIFKAIKEDLTDDGKGKQTNLFASKKYDFKVYDKDMSPIRSGEDHKDAKLYRLEKKDKNPEKNVQIEIKQADKSDGIIVRDISQNGTLNKYTAKAMVDAVDRVVDKTNDNQKVYAFANTEGEYRKFFQELKAKHYTKDQIHYAYPEDAVNNTENFKLFQKVLNDEFKHERRAVIGTAPQSSPMTLFYTAQQDMKQKSSQNSVERMTGDRF
ncbi:MAG: hypothetical protein EP298_00675 [Gammaproteobacteria bacterium]|nr:MAG: hypothetical protein EP298_00675 [Gammaproteobacteria bacterium]UTW41867.1 hypothetical protein KFE69_10180 [bacterium SCSIO 12844]